MMTQNIGSLTRTTKEVMAGMTLTVRMPRSFTIRTRIACWLIGLAGRVLDVPAEIEMSRDGDIRPGDVVREFVSGKLMTVSAIVEGRAECLWFEDHTLCRGTFGLHLLTKPDAPSPR